MYQLHQYNWNGDLPIYHSTLTEEAAKKVEDHYNIPIGSWDDLSSEVEFVLIRVEPSDFEQISWYLEDQLELGNEEEL